MGVAVWGSWGGRAENLPAETARGSPVVRRAGHSQYLVASPIIRLHIYLTSYNMKTDIAI